MSTIFICFSKYIEEKQNRKYIGRNLSPGCTVEYEHLSWTDSEYLKYGIIGILFNENAIFGIGFNPTFIVPCFRGLIIWALTGSIKPQTFQTSSIYENNVFLDLTSEGALLFQVSLCVKKVEQREKNRHKLI